jgi:hypothetical protein
MSNVKSDEDIENRINELRSMVHHAVGLRKQAIVYGVAQKLFDAFQSVCENATMSVVQGKGSWVRIESLSQLRAAVGGRFRNLKEKWTGAGLPLREHRGDRTGKANLSFDGWVELAAWITKQGYEVKLAGDDEPWLFEVRRITS